MSLKFRNSRTKAKAKLLALGALLFSFGVATSAVATSAWYNLLDIAVVSNLNLKVDVSEAWMKLGLKQSPDAEPIWIDENHPDGFTKQELGITDDTKLTDISGMYMDDLLNSSSNRHELFPSFSSRYRPFSGNTKYDEPVENRNKTYVQNEYVLATGMDTDIYLDPSSYIQPNIEANTETANHDEDKLRGLNKVSRAVRVSFYCTDIPSEDSEEISQEYDYIVAKHSDSQQAYFGGILDLNKDGYYDSLDGKEVLYGVYNESDIITGPVSETDSGDVIEAKNSHSTFVGVHKQGVEQVNAEQMKEEGKIKKENAYTLEQVSFDVNDPVNPLKAITPICHVKAGVNKRIVISIYVEGWDLDMTNDIDNAKFDINIAFTGLVKD